MGKPKAPKQEESIDLTQDSDKEGAKRSSAKKPKKPCHKGAAPAKNEMTGTPPTASQSQPGADAGTLPPVAPGVKASKKRAPRMKHAEADKAKDGEADVVDNKDSEIEAAGVSAPGRAKGRSTKSGPSATAVPKARGRKTAAVAERVADEDAHELEAEAEASDGGGVWGPHGEEVEEEEVDLDSSVGYNFTESMEPPAELLMPLLPYQKQFLAWAIKQERGTVKGGILADEMGMGKTIQAISVLVTHRDDEMAFVFDGSEEAKAAASAKVIKDAAEAAVAAARPRISLVRAQEGGRIEANINPHSGRPSASSNPVKKESAAKEEVSIVPSVGSTDVAGYAPLVAPSSSVFAAFAADKSVTALVGAKEGRSSRSKKAPAETVEKACVNDDTKTAPLPSVAVAHCPHVKPGKKAAPGVICQECLRDQAPQAQVQGERPFAKTTLVICPVVAIIQWTQEIARFTSPGALKVLVYHGNKRSTSTEELERADVVLTTYSTIENEFRRFMQPSKICCSYCKRRFYPDRLKVHLRFFCGPNAVKSDALAKQQKKRPRGADEAGGSKDDALDIDEKGDEDEDSEDQEEDDEPKPRKRGKVLSKAGMSSGKPVKHKPEKVSTTSEKSKPEKAAKKRVGKKAKKGGSDDDSDEDFDAEAEEGDEGDGGGMGGSSLWERRMAYKRWYMGWASKGGEGAGDAGGSGSGWADQAEKEAQEMIEAAEEEAEEQKRRGGIAQQSILHQVRWRRIVLDEAHCIKDRRCSTAKAVFKLDSKYKWAMSGTPLQNRVTELYSLIRFLRLYPYSYYFSSKKGVDCSSLDYPFPQGHRQCTNCQGGPMSHFCWWNRFVANPIKNYGYQGKGRSAMLLLKNKIMPSILLRRTKVQCADDLCLPPRTLILRKDRFDEREDDFYQALYTQSQAMFGSYVESGTVLNNYAHIFDLLIRLRQAVCHPYLVVHSATGPPASGTGTAALAQENKSVVNGGSGSKADESAVCGICHEDVEESVTSACGHPFCRACLVEYIEGAVRQAQCPTCSKPLTVDLTGQQQQLPPSASTSPSGLAPLPTGRVAKKHNILSRINLANFQSSTKIEALREELHRMLSREPCGKALVFSQFTSMLALIQHRLEQVGIRVVRLDGSMTLDARDRVIKQFTNDPEVRVFLMSLKAGGVALNLTVASHVMLMDPWWNPAVEAQAMDRIHRLGQYKPITVVRFVIGGTIEERILKLQEKKQLVFEGTVGRDMEALGRLTEDDLRFLFG